MNNPERQFLKIFRNGLKTPDSPGVNQRMWKYNSGTNNYDYIGPEVPKDRMKRELGTLWKVTELVR
ncbi:hypothetical protein KKE03_04535 [Patescibacteria group bacterium]|nr:hypothetical protein [Patescibacteria group bacterium]